MVLAAVKYATPTTEPVITEKITTSVNTSVPGSCLYVGTQNNLSHFLTYSKCKV